MISALEKLSHTNANYIARFITNIVICAFLLVRGFQFHADQTLLCLLAVGFGLSYYGFLEYSIHRWIFHGNWLADDNTLKRGHTYHHESEEERIAQPFFFQIIIGLASWAPISLFLPPYFVAYFMFGLFSGYLYYGLLHHAMHVGYKYRSRYFRHLAALHALHHNYPDRNFGIIGKIWDKMFGTGFRRVSSS